MPEERDDLDLQIDSALAHYAEPSAGLEARILTQLASVRTSETAPARKRWLLWPIALPIAACAILLVVFALRYTHKPTTQQAQRTAPQTQSAQNTTIPQPSPPRKHNTQPHLVAARVSRHITHKPAPLPKLDVFPTPRPLSPEEQAMVRFVATMPPSEIQAMQKAQQQQDQPLHIAAIVIQPIKPLNETEK
jgi:hypothetical protein